MISSRSGSNAMMPTRAWWIAPPDFFPQDPRQGGGGNGQVQRLRHPQVGKCCVVDDALPDGIRQICDRRSNRIEPLDLDQDGHALGLPGGPNVDPQPSSRHDQLDLLADDRPPILPQGAHDRVVMAILGWHRVTALLCCICDQCRRSGRVTSTATCGDAPIPPRRAPCGTWHPNVPPRRWAMCRAARCVAAISAMEQPTRPILPTGGGEMSRVIEIGCAIQPSHTTGCYASAPVTSRKKASPPRYSMPSWARRPSGWRGG